MEEASGKAVFEAQGKGQASEEGSKAAEALGVIFAVKTSSIVRRIGNTERGSLSALIPDGREHSNSPLFLLFLMTKKEDW